MAGYATRPSFAGHTGGGAKTNHELTSTLDHQMGAGQTRLPTLTAGPDFADGKMLSRPVEAVQVCTFQTGAFYLLATRASLTTCRPHSLLLRKT